MSHPSPLLKAVSFADRRIGPGRRALIVAEIGVNHDGDEQRALQLIDAAAEARADAVKFQLFRADQLATAQAAAATYQRRGPGVQTQRQVLAGLELNDAAFRRLRAHCNRRGLLFLATPFGVDDVDRLVALDPPAIKLASTDLDNLPLIRRAAAAGLPLIVSTGAATPREIHAAVCTHRALGSRERVILLHCVSSYPTPLPEANLRAITSLQQVFRMPVGYSDHTPSTHSGAWAIAAGACVLEKHLTWSTDAAGPDHASSLDPERFAAYVHHARQAESALGDGTLGMRELETDVRAAGRKSVVTTRRITAGTVITADLLTTKRPGDGIPAGEFDSLLGRRTRCDIAPDAPIAWDMLEDA